MQRGSGVARRRAHAVVVALLGMLVGSTALADSRRVAVFVFKNQASLETNGVELITDLVRKEALDRLPKSDYLVMDRDTILKLLPPGSNLADCIDNRDCVIDTGQRVGADYIVAGKVRRIEGSLSVSMTMYDTRKSRLLATENASGVSVSDLQEPVKNKARLLFDRLLGGFDPTASGSLLFLRVEPPPPAAEITIDDNLVNPKQLKPRDRGFVVHVVPGKHIVAASCDGHMSLQEQVFVPEGQIREVELNLPRALPPGARPPRVS